MTALTLTSRWAQESRATKTAGNVVKSACASPQSRANAGQSACELRMSIVP